MNQLNLRKGRGTWNGSSNRIYQNTASYFPRFSLLSEERDASYVCALAACVAANKMPECVSYFPFILTFGKLHVHTEYPFLLILLSCFVYFTYVFWEHFCKWLSFFPLMLSWISSLLFFFHFPALVLIVHSCQNGAENCL